LLRPVSQIIAREMAPRGWRCDGRCASVGSAASTSAERACLSSANGTTQHSSGQPRAPIQLRASSARRGHSCNTATGWQLTFAAHTEGNGQTRNAPLSTLVALALVRSIGPTKARATTLGRLWFVELRLLDWRLKFAGRASKWSDWLFFIHSSPTLIARLNLAVCCSTLQVWLGSIVNIVIAHSNKPARAVCLPACRASEREREHDRTRLYKRRLCAESNILSISAACLASQQSGTRAAAAASWASKHWRASQEARLALWWASRRFVGGDGGDRVVHCVKRERP